MESQKAAGTDFSLLGHQKHRLCRRPRHSHGRAGRHNTEQKRTSSASARHRRLADDEPSRLRVGRFPNQLGRGPAIGRKPGVSAESDDSTLAFPAFLLEDGTYLEGNEEPVFDVLERCSTSAEGSTDRSLLARSMSQRSGGSRRVRKRSSNGESRSGLPMSKIPPRRRVPHPSTAKRRHVRLHLVDLWAQQGPNRNARVVFRRTGPPAPEGEYADRLRVSGRSERAGGGRCARAVRRADEEARSVHGVSGSSQSSAKAAKTRRLTRRRSRQPCRRGARRHDSAGKKQDFAWSQLVDDDADQAPVLVVEGSRRLARQCPSSTKPRPGRRAVQVVKPA